MRYARGATRGKDDKGKKGTNAIVVAVVVGGCGEAVVVRVVVIV